MNEVGFNQAQGVNTPKPVASSKGVSVADTNLSGKELPDVSPSVASKDPTVVSEAQQAPNQKPEEVDDAVAKVNDYVQSIERDLQFTVDEELERTVVKVVDTESGDLIRQIPGDVFLELARNLKEDGELRLVNALG